MIHPNAAGLDIGSEEIWAAVAPDRTAEPVRKFGTFTPDLQALADWLIACGVDTVALESTGVCTDPGVRDLGSPGLEGVRGECPPREERARAQERHPRLSVAAGVAQRGLLRGSFRPAGEIVALRAYLRQRATLIQYRAAYIQHMQKALQQMNVQLTQVVSDITGVTGLTILRAICWAGSATPSNWRPCANQGSRRRRPRLPRR